MTYTRPCRLTSLQFSQIRLTLERTFMANLNRAENTHAGHRIHHCRDAQTTDKVHFPDFPPFFGFTQGYFFPLGLRRIGIKR